MENTNKSLICKSCGKESEKNAVFCSMCGNPLQSQNENSCKVNPETVEESDVENKEKNQIDLSQKSISKKSLKIKITVIILIVIGIVSAWGIWFASTRCSYNGCYEHKASSDHYCSYHRYYMNSLLNLYSDDYSNKSKSDLKISDIDVYTNSAATYCTGTITNNGEDTFKFVKVKGSFENYYGNVIETGDSYAVGSEGLAPGESTTFTISCTRNSDVRSCSVSIYDYD